MIAIDKRRCQSIVNGSDSEIHKLGNLRMDLFIRHPAFALGPAVLFIAAYFHCRVAGGRGFRFSRFAILSTGVVWILYTHYELRIQQEWRPGDVPIRVDLLLVYPTLLVVTLLGIIAYLIGFRRRNGHTSHPGGVA